jgi:hypothetical protein
MKTKMQLIQPRGVQDIADYLKENGLKLEDVEKHKSTEYQYKRCEGDGSYVKAPFYIINGNFYTNWDC